MLITFLFAVGTKVSVQHLGLNIARQLYSKCADCAGKGEYHKEKDLCKSCKGHGTIEEDKKINVHIDKGMRNGQKILYRGEGSHMPGTEKGDVVAVLNQEPHPVFRVLQMASSDCNLITHQTISVTEALCGFSVVLKHLDGRQLHIHNLPGEVIKHKDLKVVKHEGMPKYKSPFEHGDLYIKFHVEFPASNSLSESDMEQLKMLLPPGPDFVPPEDGEEVDLVEYDPNESRSRGGEAYNSSDDEDHGPRVQCQSH
jgi:DnaJ family protein A protein 2